jgi:hypothetical protein
LGLHYIPFKQDGRPVKVRAQEVFTLISPEEKPARLEPFPNVTDPNRLSLQLSRSGCYGSCPSYTVIIRGDGTVSYRGNRYVSIPGEHVSRIDAAKVTALLERFRAANFFGLRDSYSAYVTDVPTYEISVRVGDRAKVIGDRFGERAGMPTAITELEEAVDLAADSARWVTSSPATLEAMRTAGIALKSQDAGRILRTAVSSGDLVTVRALLVAGTPVSVSPNSPKPSNELAFDQPSTQSLLELAVESRGDRLQMLRIVLTSVTLREELGGLQQALANTVISGDTDLAVALINAGADTSARFGDRSDKQRKPDRTYLMLAAASGVWEMIDDALSRPHNIRAVDSEGRTALFHLAYSAPQTEDIFPLVDRFLAAGADRAELDQILLGTCQPNWIPGLVVRGGNINVRGKGGNTPLFQPCTVEGVQALLDAGSDPTLRNDEGKTAVEQVFHPTQGREDSRAAVIRRFIESRTRPTVR